jgi:hypothetical protein
MSMIRNDNGMLTLNEVVITGNEATGNDSAGGGIASGGILTIHRSTIADNMASGAGAGVFHSGTRLLVEQSTVSGNATAGNGGGIYGASRELFLVNSTISGNRANNNGGGLYIGSFSGLPTVAELRHSTLTANRANADFVGGGAGGGLFARGQLSLDHAIIAGNLVNGPGPDLTGLLGTAITAHFSLVGNSADSGLTPSPLGAPDANGNRIGGANTNIINPQLGPLADNGGPTLTHALLPASPARNAGDPAAMAGVGDVPFNDQRGVPFTRVYGGRIDMGAFESQPTEFVLGDFNRDGRVDMADYVVWRVQFGSNVLPGTGADANGDGIVDQADHAIWRSNLGQTSAAAASPIDPQDADRALLSWLTPRSAGHLHETTASFLQRAVADETAESPRQAAVVLDRVFETLGAAASNSQLY